MISFKKFKRLKVW